MPDVGTGLAGALGGAGTGFSIGGPIGAGVGGLVGLISGLFGGNKKPTTWMSTLTPQQQQAYSQMLNYLQQQAYKPAAGQYASNMGLYTLMNRFYPGQMAMPQQNQTYSNPLQLAALTARQTMGPNQMMNPMTSQYQMVQR